jgi:hypothetical protein
MLVWAWGYWSGANAAIFESDKSYRDLDTPVEAQKQSLLNGGVSSILVGEVAAGLRTKSTNHILSFRGGRQQQQPNSDILVIASPSVRSTIPIKSGD